ncbi:MAG: hypothetical protein HY855_15555 [Burkholderiales bacterium]|nr:hypothetical protein [Burkholderiales bacterium]
MTIHTWHVATWRPVFWTDDQFMAMVRRMKPLGTTVDVAPDTGLASGTVLWGFFDGATKVGIGWDWGEVRHGVVAMCDPMTVLSNVRIMAAGEDGEELDGRILRLNRAIHSLRWQGAITRARMASTERLAA